MKLILTFTLAALLASTVVAGCGDTTAPPTTTSPVSQKPEPPKPKPKKLTYKQTVIACLDESYEVSKAGNATRVESSWGKPKANVQFFKTKDEAAEYFIELLVDGYWGGRAVAIWLNDASDSDRAVIGECLGSR